MNLLQTFTGYVRQVRAAGRGRWHSASNWFRMLTGSAWLLIPFLVSCSQESARRENSELRAEASDTTIETRATAVGTAAAADKQANGPLTGAGSRYRVAVETAYFFDKPEQSTPNGRYLRRGDTFYGEGETNGFVKTGFVQPNGAAGTAWLKVQGLRKLAAGAAASVAKASPQRPVARPAAAPPQPAESSYDADVSSNPDRPVNPGANSAGTAVVQVARSYFYNSPDLQTPRKAFCQRGDKVHLGETRGDAVYVTFTNWEKVTTSGWMRRDALR